MGRFSVDLLDRRHDPIPWPVGVEVHPERLSWEAVGGPKEATINLVGPHAALINVLEWCRFGVRVRSERGTPLWWGYIEDASVDMGAYSLGMRIDRMYNRVSVAYTYLDREGIQQRGTTGWVDDPYNGFEYAVRELRYNRSDLTEADAEDLATALINRYKDPVPYLADGSGSRNSATLICKGWWNTLNWRYFEWDIGLESHEDGSGTQAIGVGLTSSNIVFLRDGETSRIFQLGTGRGFQVGDKITISGSGAGNNGVRTVQAVTTRDSVTVTGTTISFTATDNILDSASGFDDIQGGDWLLVSGSASNNGMQHVLDVLQDSDPFSGTNYNHINVDPEIIVNESAGASVSIRRQGHITLFQGVNDEGPGVSITITPYGVSMAQKFALTNYVENWVALEIQIRINKVGSPSDSVRVAIYSDVAGLPDTSLDHVDIAAALIPSESEWVSFILPTGVTMTAAGTWWIVVSRNGSRSFDNFYTVGVDEDAGYPNGGMKVWDGSNWVDRPNSADLLFRVYGREDNGDQLVRMLYYVGLQSTFLFSAIAKVDDTGRTTRTNRDGESLVDDEVKKLLDQGTSGNVRLLAEVSDGRQVSIYPKPDLDDLPLRLRSDGVITDANGLAIEPGTSIAGKWLALEDKDLPVSVASGFTTFIESAEYDMTTNKWRPIAENIPDPFDFATLQQG